MAPADTSPIVLTADIARDAATVWRCLTEAGHTHRWWDAGVSLDARPGGRFEERWRDGGGRAVVTAGRVVRLEPAATLELTWADEDWAVETRVTFRLTESSGRTELALAHAGWDRFAGAAGARLRAQHEAGWRRHLDSLKAYVEGM